MTKISLRISALVTLSFLLGTLACSNSTGPKAGPTSGHWTGSPDVYLPLDFTVMQTDTIITGSGTIRSPEDSVEKLAVIGFVPTVSDSTPVIMTFSAENVVPAVFIGALSADGKTMTGTLTVTFIATTDTVTFTRK
ncbi:MAG TPA: hypothetical protein VNX15_12915 [Gemmatimonadales bacterium]|jgi:hypothetical protein|nr:hypothetical protein [Gemmatimonadales bacterium]